MFTARDAFDSQFIQQPPSVLKALISPHYAVDEETYLAQLIPLASFSPETAAQITRLATELVTSVRGQGDKLHLVDALLLEYGLDTQEGVVLMCLAESLLRIPDEATVDALIRDKLGISDWESHLSRSDYLLVNASTWGLMLTGKLISLDSSLVRQPLSVIGRLVSRLGEPVVRRAMHQATKIIARQFVQGRTIKEALAASKDARDKGHSHSYDMLGEAAVTAADADAHFDAYMAAIAAVGTTLAQADPKLQFVDSQTAVASKRGSLALGNPSISIKLSALHPRYEQTRQQQLKTELLPRMLALIDAAREHHVAITIDAEEADRLELSLDLFEALYAHCAPSGWNNFGLAVQAYSKRALPVLAWLAALARHHGALIPVRLVKGAYWDSEIKWAQQLGVEDYPVFTRKEATDTSYLVCARFLLSDPVQGLLYPQFATHNAHTIASIHCLSAHRNFELQRLYGMGGSLYEAVSELCPTNVRIYAPVGSYQDLLPYLARRLLENGANSSFVHRLIDSQQPAASLIKHPAEQLQNCARLANEKIPVPPQLFEAREGAVKDSGRRNSRGFNINIASDVTPLLDSIGLYHDRHWSACPIVNGEQCKQGDQATQVCCPFDHSKVIGDTIAAGDETASRAVSAAAAAYESWNLVPVAERADCLDRAADLLETHRSELIALCQLEAGKILKDAIDEVREAVDFCRYYALQARQLFGQASAMPGVTGESNELTHSGRGIFACISPWNFPLAIFTGQVMAALVAGNSVIAKPANQTGLIAFRAVQLFHEAGIPGAVLQLLLGDGARIGTNLTTDRRIAGVAFTGSTQTAHSINRNLAARDAPIASLIAETGGQNAMIVDSSALPEQVIKDVLASAFGSAGQRCSALRVLYLQDDIANSIIRLLKGAMQELQVGDPRKLQTDIGPVINPQALEGLLAHRERMHHSATLLAEAPLNEQETRNGTFLAPIVFEINRIDELHDEHFGPMLHVIRYQANNLDRVIDEINQSGFGLTLAIHSRNATFCDHIAARVQVGNIYINRNQVGAVVGSQPFGGRHLSGTGPKAGGPNYLLGFTSETTVTTNTSAMGGNAELFM